MWHSQVHIIETPEGVAKIEQAVQTYVGAFIHSQHNSE